MYVVCVTFIIQFTKNTTVEIKNHLYTLEDLYMQLKVNMYTKLNDKFTVIWYF